MEEEFEFDDMEDDDYPEMCDYCYPDNMNRPWVEIFDCNDPDIRYFRKNYGSKLKHICDDCCTERILDGNCYPLDCKIFEQKYLGLRKPQIIEILKKNNIPYEDEDSKISAKKNKFGNYEYSYEWYYFFKNLPNILDGGREVDFQDIRVLYNSETSTKLQIIGEDSSLLINLKVLDAFKESGFIISNYYLKEIERENEGESFQIKLFIAKFEKEEGNFHSEYLVLRMFYGTYIDYRASEYLYDPHQIRIKTVNLIKKEDEDSFQTLKIYFAKIDQRKVYYNTEKGFYKKEIIPYIKNQIDKNLKRARKKGANFIIFPEYCLLSCHIPDLIEFSKKYNILIIGGSERMISKEYNLDLNKSAAFIINPNGEIKIQLKNIHGKDDPPFHPGQELIIFNSKFGSFCVLLCSDFLHDSLLLKIQEQVDFFLVLSFNRDIKTFNSRAYERCLTNYCYVFINNIKKYKGWGIYTPFSGKERHIKLPRSNLFEVNLREFSLHRRKIAKSKNYKNLLSDTFYNYGFYHYK